MDNELATYLVEYINRKDGDFKQYFECQAEDAEHAREQCADAEPDAIIIEINWIDHN